MSARAEGIANREYRGVRPGTPLAKRAVPRWTLPRKAARSNAGCPSFSCSGNGWNRPGTQGRFPWCAGERAGVGWAWASTSLETKTVRQLPAARPSVASGWAITVVGGERTCGDVLSAWVVPFHGRSVRSGGARGEMALANCILATRRLQLGPSSPAAGWHHGLRLPMARSGTRQSPGNRRTDPNSGEFGCGSSLPSSTARGVTVGLGRGSIAEKDLSR